METYRTKLKGDKRIASFKYWWGGKNLCAAFLRFSENQ
jgi:hypothetical protein